ncbi:hypothetical protein STRDD13_00040 [Streptococcus sp. DD13]|nr:hypothetical protein STRDD13_00040 [Streptococcus sp. DD13]
MLVVFYLFAAPPTVKNTMNLVFVAFFVVAVLGLATLLVLGVLRISVDFWVCLFLFLVGIAAVRDLHRMEKGPRKSRKQKQPVTHS